MSNDEMKAAQISALSRINFCFRKLKNEPPLQWINNVININSIENAVNYPSMTVFFYICEYLGITPAEFFETDSVNPSKETELAQAVRGLSNQQLDTLITLAKGLKK